MTSPQVSIPFVKACACGNDFLLIETSTVDEWISADLSALSRRLCDRHQGVGADGIEWMSPHASADVEVRLINSDGSEAEISGNGTRCVAAHLCATQGKQTIAIQTGAGLKTCVLTGRTESEYEFEAALGTAAISSELRINLADGLVRGIPVVVGNPHYVVFVRDFPDDWQKRAAEIQSSPAFAATGVNVEMVVVDGPHDIRARFFERGAGETQSSGTGSCAAALASMSSGTAQSPLRVHAPGGIQTVRKDGERIFLRGSARLVCSGEFFLTG